MEEHAFTTAVRVDHDGIAHVETPAERDLLAVGRPDGIEFVDRVFRELSDSTPVRVHGVDLEVAVDVPSAVKRDSAVERSGRGHTELRLARVGGGGEGSLGAIAGGEQRADSDDGDEPAGKWIPHRRLRWVQL